MKRKTILAASLAACMAFAPVASFASPKAPGHSVSQVKRVNINTAGLKQLMSIKGIGQGRAKRILAYRKTNGDFKTVDELTKVSGIGEKLIKKIGGEITVK